MKNHYNLNFNFNILKSDFVFPNPKTEIWDIFPFKPEEVLSTEAINFFKSINLELYNCQLFRGAPGMSCGIHLDGHTSNKKTQLIWAMNWIFGSESSSMCWYKPIDKAKETKTAAGTSYQTWELDQVEEIDRASFKGPVLVRNDIPHRVINHDTKNSRWCVSVRATKMFESWKDSVNFFKPYICI